MLEKVAVATTMESVDVSPTSSVQIVPSVSGTRICVIDVKDTRIPLVPSLQCTNETTKFPISWCNTENSNPTMLRLLIEELQVQSYFAVEI